MKLPVLALALLLAVTGCGGSDKPSSQSTSRASDPATPTSKPSDPATSLITAPPVGTVQGRLMHAGGPSGVGSGPWAGTLRIVGPNTDLKAKIGANGRFSILLPPGRYRVTATSPRYNSGRVPCRTTPAVTEIKADQTVSADVICSLM